MYVMKTMINPLQWKWIIYWKDILAIFFVFVIPNWAVAQNQDIYHLKSNQHVRVAIKSKQILDSIKQYKYTDPVLAIQYAESLIILTAHEPKRQIEYAKAIYWYGWLVSRKRPGFYSLQFLEDDLKIATIIFQKQKMWLWLAKSFHLQADAFLGQLNKEHRNPSAEEEAKIYLRKAQESLDKIEFKDKERFRIQTDIYYSQAILKHRIGSTPGEIAPYFDRCLALYQEVKDTASQAKIFLDQMKYVPSDSALHLQQQAAAIYNDLGYELDEAQSYLNLLDYSLVQYRTSKDSLLFQTARQAVDNYMTTLTAPEIECDIFIREAEMIKLQAKQSNDNYELYETAFYTYQAAYHLGMESHSLDCAKIAAQEMTEICHLVKKCESASKELSTGSFKEFERLITMNRQDSRELNRFRLSEARTISQKRTQIFILLLIILCISAISFFLVRRQFQTVALTTEKNKRLTMQRIVQKSRLDKHFLTNALNNIQGLINLNKKAAANKYVANLGNYIDSVLTLKEGESVSLEMDFHLNQLFMRLNKLAFPNKVSYEIHKSESDLELNSINIPPLIAQPDIENAIKHGLRNKNTLGTVKLSLKKHLNQNRLTYIIEDDGVGRKLSEEINQQKGKRNRESMGVKIVEKTLHALNEQNKVPLGQEINHPAGAYRVVEDLIDENNVGIGTKVYITFPFTTKETKQ